MAKKISRAVSAKLTKAGTLINNSLNEPDILSAVAGEGYTLGRLNEGKGILDNTIAIKDSTVAKKGTQKSSTVSAKQIAIDAFAAYQDYSTLAKGEFKDQPALLSVLGLDKPMSRARGPFISAGKTLFDNASSEPVIKAAMLQYGYTDEKLASEKGKILAYESAGDVQKAATGTSQVSTESLGSAMKKLNDWTSQYTKAAKIALKKNKQLLEKLGIRVRSGRTKAQRNAAKKAVATKAAKRAAAKK